MLLTLMGHEVRAAHDGPTALDAAESFRPDVVLLDIGLPGMDGYEVARRIRQIARARRASSWWPRPVGARTRTAAAPPRPGFDHTSSSRWIGPRSRR